MKVLGIETSAHHSSLALLVDGHLERESFFPSRMSLGQTLASHIQEVLGCPVAADAGLTAIGVSLGPGSFTGLRVGIAAAKALAHALGIPLVGIPTHEAIAWPVASISDRSICILQHARTDQVYCTLFAPGLSDGHLQPIFDTCVLPISALVGRLTIHARPLIALGDGLERHGTVLRDALREELFIPPSVLQIPRAAVVAKLASERAAQADPGAAMNLRPTYLLVSQAEMSHNVDLGQK
ncbi:MAG: tRNA (adenosine(37)-N6)-threonylcarbamoyltransferase complex dimerization subunit type 1 TsaB [Armatimonadetes bacterium]|nr:tRNA (adenosine(37)-N6)-threonylcarbamoyltransferase complex dimerization subunit type 1 TsaB [Armatimonadota bacterium]